MDTSVSNGVYWRITDGYLRLWQTIDHRVDGWFLMSSFQPVLILVMVYFGLVFIGPLLMRNRKPFTLTSTMIIYNAIVVLLNLCITIQFLTAAFRRKFNWNCDVNQYDATDVEEMRIIAATHLFLVSKPIEWFDTLFFILRKKDNQMTFLHIYHHFMTFILAWIITRWIPNESSFILFVFNSSIHVIMYTYYILAALGPDVQKYLWWKKYLTSLQMIQFVVGIVVMTISIIKGCSSNPWALWSLAVYYVSLLYLFQKFYQSAYKKKKSN